MKGWATALILAAVLVECETCGVPDEPHLVFRDRLLSGGPPSLCLGEPGTVFLGWAEDGPSPDADYRLTHDDGVAAIRAEGELGSRSVELTITCFNPGTIELVATAVVEIEGRDDREFEAGLTVTCEICADAGQDGSLPPLARPALSFGAELIPDFEADFVESAGGDAAYTGAEVDIAAHGSEVEMQSMADADTDFNNSTFECGETVGTQWTACAADVQPMPEGDLVTVVTDLRADVPPAADGSSYIYAVVFDSDGDPANDYTPEPGFPLDYFQGTDRWYELIWDHVAGRWTVRVTQLDAAGTRVEVASSVRAVVDGARVTFFIARGELPASVPLYRVTAFRHDGAFALESRGGDVSMGTPTLPLLALGCGFVGAECRDDSLDRGLEGSLPTCGGDGACALIIQPGSFRGACAPAGAPRCGMGAGTCDPALTCAAPPDRTGYCLDEGQLDCLCATESGQTVFSSACSGR